MAFATVAELEDWLGYPIDPTENDRATLLLDVATATIQNHCRQTIEQVADDTATLHGTWEAVLDLPERPVVTVTSVTVDGVLQTVNDDYVVVRDQLRRPRVGYVDWQHPGSGFDPFAKTGWGGPNVEVVVVYTHGWATIPSDVKGICLALATRAWQNPEAVRQKQLDSDHASVYGDRYLDLSDGEKKTLDRYRRRARAVSTW